MYIHGLLPPYRVCNQTRRCTGPRLVIFKAPPIETPGPAPVLGVEGVMGWTLSAVSAELTAAAAVSAAELSQQAQTRPLTWNAISERWATSRNEQSAVGLHLHLGHTGRWCLRT